MNYQSLLQPRLAEFAAEHPAPQIVCAICRDGKLVAVASETAPGFAPLRDPTQTSFRIASMTKCFAAAAILKLRDEGRLQLDRSAADYLPEMALTSRWQAVTIRQLLRMRSGLAGADDAWADRRLSEPDAFINADLLNSAHFSNEPNEEYQYSNLGYMVLGRIISNAAKQPAMEYIGDALLKPLGMMQTSWNIPAVDGLHGYRATPGGFEHATEFHSQADLAMFGGLCSTLQDLAVWVDFLAEAHRPQDDRWESILAARSRREMQRAMVVMHPLSSTDAAARPIGYGYGLRANYFGSEWFVGHSGGLPGYGSHMSWSPTRGLGVIALGNVTYFPAISLCREILVALQEKSPRPVAHLVHGEKIVLNRGNALLAAIRSGAAELPAELFSYNVPLDEEMKTLPARLQAALVRGEGRPLEVRAERGFAGAIYAGDKPLVFFSLAPIEDYRIQQIDFYD